MASLLSRWAVLSDPASLGEPCDPRLCADGLACAAAVDNGRCELASCASGTVGTPPHSSIAAKQSCAGLAHTCGASGNDDCCASSLVPGGTFYRDYDAHAHTSQAYPAKVSDFQLDTYEITVGRFREFLNAYSPTLVPQGAGKNPHNQANDPGWDAANWNTLLPANAPLAVAKSGFCTSYGSWTDAPGPSSGESRPINCLSWYQPWFGKFTPSDARSSPGSSLTPPIVRSPSSSVGSTTPSSCVRKTSTRCTSSQRLLHMHGELAKSRCERGHAPPFEDTALYPTLADIPRCDCGGRIPARFG